MHLVRAGNDYLLLGSAEHGVMPIHRYTEEEAREAGLLDVIEPSARAAARRCCAARRRRLGDATRARARRGHDPMSMPAPGPGSSLIDRLRELTVRR